MTIREPAKEMQIFTSTILRFCNAFEEKLLFAIEEIRKADLIIFIGMGSSGTLAKYEARYFSNLGHLQRAGRCIVSDRILSLEEYLH